MISVPNAVHFSCTNFTFSCLYWCEYILCVDVRAYLHSAVLLSCSHHRGRTHGCCCFSLFMPMRCLVSVFVFLRGSTRLASNSAAGFQSTSSSGGGSLIRQAIQMSPAIHFILERRRCSRREIHQTCTTLNESIGEITSRLDLIYTCRLSLLSLARVCESGKRHSKLFKYFTPTSVQLHWSMPVYSWMPFPNKMK